MTKAKTASPVTVFSFPPFFFIIFLFSDGVQIPTLWLVTTSAMNTFNFPS